MSENAILLRLNVIILLLLAIVAILLWPIVSPLLFAGVAILYLGFVLAVAGVVGWVLLQTVWNNRT